MSRQTAVFVFCIIGWYSTLAIAGNKTSFEISGEIKPKCEVIRHGQHLDVRFHIDGQTMSKNVNIRCNFDTQLQPFVLNEVILSTLQSEAGKSVQYKVTDLQHVRGARNQSNGEYMLSLELSEEYQKVINRESKYTDCIEVSFAHN